MPIVMFVDGSLRSSGIAIGEVNFGNVPKILHLERFKTSDKEPLEKSLTSIAQRGMELIKEYGVEYVIMEAKYVHRNAKTAMTLGQADAAWKVGVGLSGVRIGSYDPNTIKFHTAGFANAEKDDMERSVVGIYKDQPIVTNKIKASNIGKKGAPKQDDLADACGGLYTYSMIPKKISVA